MIKAQYAKNIKSLHYRILMMLFVVFMPLSLLAQNIKISGKVLDNNQEPVAGATVAVKNTTNGTIADIDGNYTIEAAKDAILVFKFLGLSTKE